jgi:hypothetical protein
VLMALLTSYLVAYIDALHAVGGWPVAILGCAALVYLAVGAIALLLERIVWLAQTFVSRKSFPADEALRRAQMENAVRLGDSRVGR